MGVIVIIQPQNARTLNKLWIFQSLPCIESGYASPAHRSTSGSRAMCLSPVVNSKGDESYTGRNADTLIGTTRHRIHGGVRYAIGVISLAVVCLKALLRHGLDVT